MIEIFQPAVLALAVANTAASVGLLFSAAYTNSQKGLQLALIWLVPVLGVVAVWIFLRENRDIARPASRSEGSLTTPGYDYAPGDGGPGGH